MDLKKSLLPLLKVELPKEFIDEIIPVFAPRTEEERSKDKYESATENVDFYTGGIAYANELLNIGGAEGLYSTINYLILKYLDKDKEYKILDLACGVGRTMYDLAELFKNSLFVGLDYSYLMVKRSKQILLNNEKFEIDLESKGLGKLTLQGKNYKNVILTQGDVYNLPFKTNIFDCVCNTFLIDRVADAEKAIKNSIEVLKKGGLFILTDPLNFNSKANWNNSLNAQKVVDIIKSCGIDVINWHDGLLFKEKMDLRENYYNFSTLVVYGFKK